MKKSLLWKMASPDELSSEKTSYSLISRSSDLYVSYPFLAYLSSSTFAASKSLPQGVFLKLNYFPKASWITWLVLLAVKGFGLQHCFVWNTDPLFRFELESGLPKRNNCCNDSIWTEPLDSLFLLVSVTVWHKNILNRKYEQNVCLWEFFFYWFIYGEKPTSSLSSLSWSCTWLQKCGNDKDVTVVLQPRCALPCGVTHGASCCSRGWRTTTWREGREKLPMTA